MANTAEELGRRYGITREQADEFGYRSHKNAKNARDAGWFDEEITPVSVKRTGQASRSSALRHSYPRNVSMEKMARLRAAFEPGGIITAGNASAVVDGAAAMVIGKESDADEHRAANRWPASWVWVSRLATRKSWVGGPFPQRESLWRRPD